jgi:hypothetical protein
MTTVPFALSVHKLINSVGTDLAFAAILGLAILVLLYFAQARETASLRERLDNAAQWIDTLESRLTQLQRGQAQAAAGPSQPAPAPAGAGLLRPRPGQPAAGRPGAVPAAAGASSSTSRPMRGPLLGAPAGMAGPALAAATHLVPLSGQGAVQPVAAPSGNGEGQTRVGAPVLAASPAAAGAGTQSAPAGDDTILAVPAPATAAALANGQGPGGVAAAPAPRPSVAPAPAGVTPAGGPPYGSARTGPAFGPARTGGNGGSRPPAAALSSRSAGARQFPPLRTTAPSAPSRASRLVPILIGLAAVVVIVVALLIVTQNNSSSTTVHKSHVVSARGKHGRTAAVVPSTVTVAVLNGTTVTNLAHDVAGRLGTDGYKEGTIATAADQTHSSTVVAYLSGHQADARAVAAVLNLKASSVAPVNQQAMGVACPGASSATPSSVSTSSATPSSSSACSADVVVTVGSDLAGLASSAAG